MSRKKKRGRRPNARKQIQNLYREAQKAQRLLHEATTQPESPKGPSVQS